MLDTTTRTGNYVRTAAHTAAGIITCVLTYYSSVQKSQRRCRAGSVRGAELSQCDHVRAADRGARTAVGRAAGSAALLWHHRLPTVWERGLGANEADFSEQRGLLTTPGKRRCSRWRLRLPKSCSSRELFITLTRIRRQLLF